MVENNNDPAGTAPVRAEAPPTMTDGAFSRRFLLKGAAASIVLRAMPALAQKADPFQPFTYRASDEALADLKRRLDDTRWPEAATEPGFAQGPPLAATQQLIAVLARSLRLAQSRRSG